MSVMYQKLERMASIPAPAGTTTARTQHATEDGITLAYGTTVPTDTTAGYAPGCIFIHVDGSAGGVLYTNEGSATSCNFDVLVTDSNVAAQLATANLTTLTIGGVAYTLPAADGSNGQQLTTDGAGTMSWAASGATFTGGNITGDCTLSNGVDLQSSTTTAHTNAILVRDVDGAAYVDALRITNADTPAVALGSATTSLAVTSTGLNVSTAGAVTGVSTLGASGLITASGGITAAGDVTLGDDTGDVVVASTNWDVSSAGAISAVSLALSDDITMANGKAIKSSTTDAQTVSVQGYDVNGATYVSALTITNGNTPATVLGNSNGTTAITSSDWAIGTTGDATGIGAVTMDGVLTVNNASIVLYNNEAITVSHATNGAADDLTISLTGATDSSIIVQSAGTGEDTIKLNATAGGVDVDAAAAKDVNIAGGQVALVSKDDAASAISLTTNIGTSETIVVTNTAGTGEAAITLTSTAGGIDVDAAAAKNIDIAGGQVLISSKDNAANAIALTTDVGVSETIVVTNTQGTDEASISLIGTAGGVNVDAAAAKNVTIDGGQVLIGSKDNAANAIALTTDVGTSETIVVTNTQGTNAAAVNLTASAGGVTLSAATDGKGITLTGDVYVKKGSDIASPAGGELDLTNGVYFDITGTNNITSIAAADSIAGRLIILQFDGVLTFTDGNNLKLSGNFVTSADDTITLICDGTNWHEVCRSVN